MEVPLPFPRLPYAEAMARYGSDKPDLRFGLPIADVSQAFQETGFVPFRESLESGGVVRGWRCRASGHRRDASSTSSWNRRQFGAAGLCGCAEARTARSRVLRSRRLAKRH